MCGLHNAKSSSWKLGNHRENGGIPLFRLMDDINTVKQVILKFAGIQRRFSEPSCMLVDNSCILVVTPL